MNQKISGKNFTFSHSWMQGTKCLTSTETLLLLVLLSLTSWLGKLSLMVTLSRPDSGPPRLTKAVKRGDLSPCSSIKSPSPDSL